MAKLVNWSDELSVGIKEIDDQHKELVEMLNRMDEAIRQRRGSAVVRPILNEIAEYTRGHFAIEEALMRASAYPEYEEHKAQHEDLMAQVEELQSKLNAGSHAISFALIHFLKGWLTKHIIETDKRYTPYLKGRTGANSEAQTSWWTKLWGAKRRTA